MSEVTLKNDTAAARTPLYIKVTHQLREHCFAAEGEMLPPLRQLSQMLNVNHATVSRALRDLEREGLVEIVPRKGIFSIPVSKSNAGMELVVLVSEQVNLLDVAKPILDGMRRERKNLAPPEAAKVTRSILAVPPFPDADRFVAEVKARGTGGIVLLGFGFFKDEQAAQEERFISEVSAKIPVVLAGSPQTTFNLDCVYGDTHIQMQEFLEHCYEQGLRRFEYLGSRGNNLLQRSRREEFDNFTREKGLDWEWRDLRTLDAVSLTESLRAMPEFPEVVVATNVQRAMTVALEAQRRGLKLPQDLHLLCFASLLEHAQPLLPYATVVMMDEPGVGARAVQVLQNRMKAGRDSEPQFESVPAHFASGPLYGTWPYGT